MNRNLLSQRAKLKVSASKTICFGKQKKLFQQAGTTFPTCWNKHRELHGSGDFYLFLPFNLLIVLVISFITCCLGVRNASSSLMIFALS